MSDELNLKTGALALFFLGITFISIIALLWVPPIIAFTLVVTAFVTFSTITLMSAKTTGGPIG